MKTFGGFFEIEKKEQDLKLINKQIASPNCWKDYEKLSCLNKEKSMTSQIINNWKSLAGRAQEGLSLLSVVKEENDEQYLKELKAESKALVAAVEKLEIQSFLNGDHDSANAYLTIHSGAGGTEAQDWSFMLYRMYLRWAEKQGLSVETASLLEGESAGIKSVSLKLSGPYAYGYLKSESGVHRLVRISPFDSNKRRHTSFSSVFAWPEIQDNIKIEIKTEDIRVDTYRASGAGGQHVNKTDSAVRLTHLPTGQVVQCQNQRSQYANKNQAMKMLRSALYKMEFDKRNKEKQEKESSKKANEWGSQIRSYVLHPYRMVKDHRTLVESPQPELVLDGDLDIFISAGLKLK